MTYPIHPVADLFPLKAEGPAWEQFLLDVELHGVREPIVLWKGRCIDGRRRLRAVSILRERGGKAVTMPAPIEWSETGGSLVAWVYSANLHRRDLSASERAMLVADFSQHVENECAHRGIPNVYGELARCVRCGKSFALVEGGEARVCDEPVNLKVQKKTGCGPICGGAILHPSKINGKTVDSQAKAAGVSRRTMQLARKVAAKGTEETKAVGRKSVARAAKLADLPEEEQVKAQQRETAAARKRVEASELQRALGEGGKQLDLARRHLAKAARAIHGYDARRTAGAIEKAQDRLAEDAARLLAQAKGRAA